MRYEDLRIGSLLINKTRHKSINSREIWMVTDMDSDAQCITVRKVYSGGGSAAMLMVVPLNVADNIFICLSR
jgi:hypothetical protein